MDVWKADALLRPLDTARLPLGCGVSLQHAGDQGCQDVGKTGQRPALVPIAGPSGL